MPNPTEPRAGSGDPKDTDHEHHKYCVYHASKCDTCPEPHNDLIERINQLHQNKFGPRSSNTLKKRPTYKHTAKPPWIDFEKQRELVPGEVDFAKQLEGNPVRLAEKITTCRIEFSDREPDRSDSGKAITIHQCEVHLVIITWDESNDS